MNLSDCYRFIKKKNKNHYVQVKFITSEVVCKAIHTVINSDIFYLHPVVSSGIVYLHPVVKADTVCLHSIVKSDMVCLHPVVKSDTGYILL